MGILYLRNLRAAALIMAFCVGAAACHHGSELHARYYRLKGTVISVDKPHKQIIVNHEAIPGFMSAMIMPYEVKDDAALSRLNAGDRITARVVVTPSDVWLDHIVIVKGAAPSQPHPQPTVEQLIPQPGDKVPDLTFINQYGRRVHFRRYQGKAVLLTFIYTRCPDTFVDSQLRPHARHSKSLEGVRSALCRQSGSWLSSPGIGFCSGPGDRGFAMFLAHLLETGRRDHAFHQHGVDGFKRRTVPLVFRQKLEPRTKAI